jgi:glycosyltransferase involved in cell wall biosynthesis
MDQVIKERLSLFVSPNRIVLSPFWIKKTAYPLSSAKAKTKLGYSKNEFVIMSFGFVTYYKGADWIINAVKKIQQQNQFKNIRLILAGGPAYSLKDKSYYEKYYAQLLEIASNNKNITITGFVPDEQIGLYFKAADLVVLPYRGLMGASGTLTHAIAYNKPFIISDSMKNILLNEDISFVLKKVGIQLSEVAFKHTSSSFAKILIRAQNPGFIQKLNMLSSEIAKERSYKKLVLNCYNRLYSSSNLTEHNLPLGRLHQSFDFESA